MLPPLSLPLVEDEGLRLRHNFLSDIRLPLMQRVLDKNLEVRAYLLTLLFTLSEYKWHGVDSLIKKLQIQYLVRTVCKAMY